MSLAKNENISGKADSPKVTKLFLSKVMQDENYRPEPNYVTRLVIMNFITYLKINLQALESQVTA